VVSTQRAGQSLRADERDHGDHTDDEPGRGCRTRTRPDRVAHGVMHSGKVAAEMARLTAEVAEADLAGRGGQLVDGRGSGNTRKCKGERPPAGIGPSREPLREPLSGRF